MKINVSNASDAMKMNFNFINFRGIVCARVLFYRLNFYLKAIFITETEGQNINNKNYIVK